MKKTTYFKNKGFTLIELLVVIAIIAILTGVVTASFAGVRQRSRDAQRKSDMRSIQSALELYRSDQGYYPSTLPACGSPLQSPTGATYIQSIPCDPMNSGTYQYIYTPSPTGCNNTSTNCSTYAISDCLENTNDVDGKPVGSSTCTSKLQYTLYNP